MTSTSNYNKNSNFEKSKFSKLNFNLKNCVFSFLPFEDSIFSMSKISKKFSWAIKSKKLTKVFKEKFEELLSLTNFDKESIANVQQCFSVCSEDNQTLNDLCAFLLLKKHKSSEILDLRQEKNLHFQVLANFLSRTKSISNLDLYDTALAAEDSSIKAFSAALAKNQSVQVVNLNFNKIGENANHMLFVSEALKRNKTLKKIYFYGNSIGKNENDFLFLGEALKENSTLEVICVEHNEITDFQRDSGLLADALRNNTSLKEIQITYNGKLDVKEIKQTKKLLKKANKNLRVK